MVSMILSILNSLRESPTYEWVCFIFLSFCHPHVHDLYLLWFNYLIHILYSNSNGLLFTTEKSFHYFIKTIIMLRFPLFFSLPEKRSIKIGLGGEAVGARKKSSLSLLSFPNFLFTRKRMISKNTIKVIMTFPKLLQYNKFKGFVKNKSHFRYGSKMNHGQKHLHTSHADLFICASK